MVAVRRVATEDVSNRDVNEMDAHKRSRRGDTGVVIRRWSRRRKRYERCSRNAMV